MACRAGVLLPGNERGMQHGAIRTVIAFHVGIRVTR